MESNLFEYITGAATVASLILATLPYFSRYRQHISYLFVFAAGMFIGGLVSRTSATTMIMSFEGNMFQAFVLLLAMLSAAFCVVVVIVYFFRNDHNEVQLVAGLLAFLLFSAFSITYAISVNPPKHADRRSSDELLTLAQYYEDRNEIPRAVSYYSRVLELERTRNGDTEFSKTLNEKLRRLLSGPD